MYRRRRNNQQPIYRVYTTSAYRSPLNMSVDRYLGGLPHTDYFAPEEAHRVATYISKQMQAARSKNKFVFVVEIMGNSVSFLDFDAGKRLSYQDFQKEYSKSFSSSTQLYKRNPDESVEYDLIAPTDERFTNAAPFVKFKIVNDTLKFLETEKKLDDDTINILIEYQVLDKNRSLPSENDFQKWWNRLNKDGAGNDNIEAAWAEIADWWEDGDLGKLVINLTPEQQEAKAKKLQEAKESKERKLKAEKEREEIEAARSLLDSPQTDQPVDERFNALQTLKKACEDALAKCKEDYATLQELNAKTKYEYNLKVEESTRLEREADELQRTLANVNSRLRDMQTAYSRLDKDCKPLRTEYDRLLEAHKELKKKCPVRLGQIDVGSVENRYNWDHYILEASGLDIFNSLKDYACYEEDAKEWFTSENNDSQSLRFAAIKENSTISFVFDYSSLIGRSFLTLEEFQEVIKANRKIIDDQLALQAQLERQRKQGVIDRWLSSRTMLVRPRDSDRVYNGHKQRWENLDKTPCRKKFDDFTDKIQAGFQKFRDRNSRQRDITVENAHKFFKAQREQNLAHKPAKPMSSSEDLSKRRQNLSEKQMYALYIDQVDVATKWQDLVHNAVPFLYKYTYEPNKGRDKVLKYSPPRPNDYAPESMDNTRIFNATPHTMSYFVGEKNPEYDDKKLWLPAFKGHTEEVFMPLSGMAIRKMWTTRAQQPNRYFWVAIFYTLDKTRNYKWKHRATEEQSSGLWFDEEICNIHAWGIIDIENLDCIVPKIREEGRTPQPIKSFVSDTIIRDMEYTKTRYFSVLDTNDMSSLKSYAALCFQNGCTLQL